MNKSLHLYTTLISLLLFININILCCQPKSISSYIHEIEANSELTFNYDENETNNIYSNFDLKDNYTKEQIIAFFNSTPIELQILESGILLLPVQKHDYRLCGSIISSIDQAPLEFANVYIKNSNGISTDQAGKFELNIKAYKNEICQISYLGYQQMSFKISELMDCPQISLIPIDFLLGHEIIVRSYIKNGIQEGRSYGGLNLDFTIPNKELNIHNQDLFLTLQQLPGITSPDDSAVNLNIRGGSVDHNLISWEGITLYDNGYLFGMISSVNPFSIDKISIYKSNHSPVFDNKIGGVISMSLTDKIPKSINSSIGFNLTEAHCNFHIPIIKNKLSVLIGGRKSLHSVYEYNPTYQSYTQKVFQTSGKEQESEEEEEEESEEAHPEIDYIDLNAKLIFQASKNIKFQSSLIKSSSNNSNISSFASIDLASNDHFYASSFGSSNRLAFKINDLDSLNISYFYSDFVQETDFSFTNNSTTTSINSKETSNKISDQKIQVDYNFGPKLNKSILGYVFDKKSTEVEIEEISILQNDIESYNFGEGTFHHAFAQHSILRNKFLLEIGGRATYALQHSRIFFSPSLSMRYKLMPSISLKTNAGIYYQFISQIHEPIDNDRTLENPIWQINSLADSPVLNSKKLSAGWVYQKSAWLIDVDAYYHQIRGLAAENPNVRNSILIDSNNELVSTGIDFLVNRKTKKSNYSIFYSLSSNSLILPIKSEMELEKFSANNDQLHNLKLISAFKLKKFDISLSHHYKSGLPFSDTRKVVDDDEDDNDTSFEIFYEQFNNTKLKDYNRTDFTVLFNNDWKKINYELGFSIFNIFNVKNIGSRKSILAETDASNMSPEILELSKNLLPRTINFQARLYW